jgi:hypothetical protein
MGRLDLRDPARDEDTRQRTCALCLANPALTERDERMPLLVVDSCSSCRDQIARMAGWTQYGHLSARRWQHLKHGIVEVAA